VKAAFERCLVCADDPRGLRRRRAHDVAQDEGGPPVIRELGHSLLQHLLEFVVERLSLRAEMLPSGIDTTKSSWF
jgi:hypothetical protein